MPKTAEAPSTDTSTIHCPSGCTRDDPEYRCKWSDKAEGYVCGKCLGVYTKEEVAEANPDSVNQLVDLKVDQCPVCLTEDANIRVYVGDAKDGSGLVKYNRVWFCECAHEWPRNPEDTAAK